jgi:sn-glycerol 3-phosphate transport system substrate-binding protein
MKEKMLGIFLVSLLLLGIINVNQNYGVVTAAGDDSRPINIVFWHSMGGNLGATLTTLVNKYNSSQKKVKINAQYQGSYEDSLNKLKVAMRTRSGPDLIQVYEGGTRFMVDSGFIIPMQKLINKGKFDISAFEKNIFGYYTVNGKLNSMPFNTSNPVLYYNVNMFKEAGIKEPPQTWDEMAQIAKKLTKKNSSGQVTQYGLSMNVNPWFFEQPLLQMGLNLVNHKNGRSAPATAVEFKNNGGALKILKAWKKLKDEGVISTSDVGSTAVALNALFTAGKTAMVMDSTASLGGMLLAVGGRFEIGTGPFPTVEPGAKGGVTLGGASLYLLNNKKSAKVPAAAFDFVKYLTTPENQVFWHKNSGYFPITTKAYELEEMKEHLKSRPQFQTAITQLHNSSNASKGPIFGAFTESRNVYITNIQKMLLGELTPEQAVDRMAEGVNTLINNYNKANAK